MNRRNVTIGFVVLFSIFSAKLVSPVSGTSQESAAVGSQSIPDQVFDVVIYGGTSGGVAAAVQVRRLGKSVVLIEPTHRLGGLTTGGLGQTDIGNKAAIGGVSLEFYQRVRAHYQKDSAWKWQKASEYRSGGQSRTGKDEDAMWTFEPSAALKIMNDLVRENKVPVVFGERLDRTTGKSGVVKRDSTLMSIRMESGKTFSGKVFLDASYEGDLLAAAGVSYTVGREANETYKETLNGVQTLRATKHQFVGKVDPYVEKGNPASGLLPGIDPKGPGKEGGKDHRVQAYCFRMCLTDHPKNRIAFEKPEDYDALNYELLFRNFEAGARVIPWSHSMMPNRKSDTNNNRGFSTDFIGQNYDYPEASYAERQKIIRRHLNYQKGLMWTLAYHPRTPAFVRNEISKWGTCRDEFSADGGWQQQLYIREARRMIGSVVMTQHHCQGKMLAEKPIGLAAYTMDSHNVQRHVGRNGFVRNEGDVQVGGFSPYPIDYGSITPRQDECSNLLVPVCLSASHIAFGSIRMEPVFMVLGQSAATAAVQAIDESKPVQQINYQKLRAQLIKDRQKLEWTGPRRTPVVGRLSSKLNGIVVDDTAAKKIGFETSSTSIGPFFDRGYVHDSNDGKGRQRIQYDFQVPKAGKYEVLISFPPFENRATNTPIQIVHADGVAKLKVNQRIKVKTSPFRSLGEFNFVKKGSLTISNQDTDGFVVADVVQVLPVK